MAAIDDLNANISALDTKLAAYITAQTGSVPSAQVETAAASVAAVTATIPATS